jgi:hypothetical protein
MLELTERGPEVIDRTPEGHRVFLRCEAEHKGQTGTFEVRDDAVVFVGDVALVIPWATVAHVANTTVKDTDAIPVLSRSQTGIALTDAAFEKMCDVDTAFGRATRLCGGLRPARNAVATTESALISRALCRPKPRRDKECLAQGKKWVPAVSRQQTPDGPQ